MWRVYRLVIGSRSIQILVTEYQLPPLAWLPRLNYDVMEKLCTCSFRKNNDVHIADVQQQPKATDNTAGKMCSLQQTKQVTDTHLHTHT